MYFARSLRNFWLNFFCFFHCVAVLLFIHRAIALHLHNDSWNFFWISSSFISCIICSLESLLPFRSVMLSVLLPLHQQKANMANSSCLSASVLVPGSNAFERVAIEGRSRRLLFDVFIFHSSPPLFSWYNYTIGGISIYFMKFFTIF